MKRADVTYSQLTRAVGALGVVRRRVPGAHPADVFEHPRRGPIMTLPVYRERMRVYAHHVAVLRHLIAQFGIAEPEAFDAEIEKVIAADRRKRTGTVPVTVELSEAELAGIKEITQLDDDAQAVVQAVRGYIRMMRLRELKAASGKVEFDLDWEQLEALERGESKRDPKNRWDAGPTDYPRG